MLKFSTLLQHINFGYLAILSCKFGFIGSVIERLSLFCFDSLLVDLVELFLLSLHNSMN